MRLSSPLKEKVARFATRVVTLGALVLATVVPGLGLAGSATLADAKSKAQYDHIFVIVEENTEYGTAIGNPLLPYFNQLASTYGLATQYFGTIHPSEGNYVGMVGGNSYGIRDDKPYFTHTINQPSIVDQLEAAGLTWKGYFQSMPTPGYRGTCFPTSPCLYASKHNGFLNFAHVQLSLTEMALLVPDTNLSADLATGAVPNFAFIVPDQCHDKHGLGGTCVDPQLSTQTDAYLQSTVNLIMSSAAWQDGTSAIVVVWDEGDTTLGCCDANPGGGQVATVVVQNQNETKLRDSTPFNHYSLVATLQAAFGLGCQFNGSPVGFTCDTANGVQPMSILFGLK
jgi:phosphatidylinositol-3-phosphatase